MARRPASRRSRILPIGLSGVLWRLGRSGHRKLRCVLRRRCVRRPAQRPVKSLRRVIPSCGSAHEPGEALLRQVQEEFGLHDLAIEAAPRASAPKLESTANRYSSCSTPYSSMPDTELAFGETRVFVGARHAVTVRHGASLPYGEVRDAIDDFHLSGASFVLPSWFSSSVCPIVDDLGRARWVGGRDLLSAIRQEVAQRIHRLKDRCSREAVSARDVQLARSLRSRSSRPRHGSTSATYDHVIRIHESIDTMRSCSPARSRRISPGFCPRNEVMKRLAVRRRWSQFHAHRRHLRHELRSQAGTALKLGYPLAIALMVGVCGRVLPLPPGGLARQPRRPYRVSEARGRAMAEAIFTPSASRNRTMASRR